MEIIRALVSIFLCLLFLSFIIRITWPLLVVFGIFILYMVLKVNRNAKNFKNTNPNNQQQYRENRQSRTNSSQSTVNRDPNIIDVEYTEEELD